MLLTTNSKLLKGTGLPCYGLQLAPHTISGYSVCPRASDADTPSNTETCIEVLNAGGTVAVPFSALASKHEALPTEWQGFPVVDGDVDDRIWTRPPGHVIGLRFKGSVSKMTSGCKGYCVYHAGMGKFEGVKGARLLRTRMLFESKALFFDVLCAEIEKLQKKHPDGVAIRLNCYSDLSWETSGYAHPKSGKTLFELFPTVRYYDYVKVERRMTQYLAGTFPKNYWLTFSFNHVWDANTNAEVKGV